MIVLDASATIEFLLQTAMGLAVHERVARSGDTLHAPHLLDVEVLQVMRRFVAAGTLVESRAAEALKDLRDLPVTRYPHDVLLPRVWQLRQNLSAYDAVYVALAEVLDAVLLTADQRLGRAPGHAARLEVVEPRGF